MMLMPYPSQEPTPVTPTFPSSFHFDAASHFGATGRPVVAERGEAGRQPVASQLMAETDGSHLRSGRATMGLAVLGR